MRQRSPTTLVLAVSLALVANAAFAQRATGGVRASGAAGVSAAASAPASAPAANANASGGMNVVTTTSGGNNVVIGAPANGTQGSNTANGTNPSPNATQGQTAGVTNGTTSGTSNGSTSPGVVPSGVANLQARLFDANGNLLTDNRGNALLTDGVSVIGVAPIGSFEGATIGVDPSQVVVANAMIAPATTTTAVTPELDRATRKELAKARSASRTNRQLVTSITPRTDVDRTDQMADDPMPLRY